MAAYIVVGYSLKNQGGYNHAILHNLGSIVGYSPKNQGSYNVGTNYSNNSKVGYSLKNQGSYNFKLKLDEFQLYIIKIK